MLGKEKLLIFLNAESQITWRSFFIRVAIDSFINFYFQAKHHQFLVVAFESSVAKNGTNAFKTYSIDLQQRISSRLTA